MNYNDDIHTQGTHADPYMLCMGERDTRWMKETLDGGMETI